MVLQSLSNIPGYGVCHKLCVCAVEREEEKKEAIEEMVVGPPGLAIES